MERSKIWETNVAKLKVLENSERKHLRVIEEYEKLIWEEMERVWWKLTYICEIWITFRMGYTKQKSDVTVLFLFLFFLSYGQTFFLLFD